MSELTVCTLCHILFGWYNRGWNVGGTYRYGTDETHKKCWPENV